MHPQLTIEMLRDVSYFVEWVLDISFSPDQREQLMQYIQKAWNQNDKDENQKVLELLAVYRGMQHLQPGHREQLQQDYKNLFLASIRSADKPINHWLLCIHEGIHPSEVLEMPDSVDVQSEAATEYMKTVENFSRAQGILDFGWKRF